MHKLDATFAICIATLLFGTMPIGGCSGPSSCDDAIDGECSALENDVDENDPSQPKAQLSWSQASCDRYIECVAAAAPETTAVALELYGNESPCWTSDAEDAALCGAACADARETHNNIPECQECELDEHCIQTGRQRCLDGTCVACLADGDCVNGQVCDEAVGGCVAIECTDGFSCDGQSLLRCKQGLWVEQAVCNRSDDCNADAGFCEVCQPDTGVCFVGQDGMYGERCTSDGRATIKNTCSNQGQGCTDGLCHDVSYAPCKPDGTCADGAMECQETLVEQNTGSFCTPTQITCDVGNCPAAPSGPFVDVAPACRHGSCVLLCEDDGMSGCPPGMYCRPWLYTNGDYVCVWL